MFTTFHATSSGNNTLIAGVSGKVIIVRFMAFQVAVATAVTLKSGTDNNHLLTGPMSFVVGGGLTIPYCEGGFSAFEVDADEPFVMSLSGLLPDVSGWIYYTLVDA